ncbi:hypothetical protein [Shouchella lehensis]|uniref:hypothetical protein n=1 Tax=Shouchella lehensis TaxID=300825 RepID=UPI00141A338B|nr:hypothetical protein [Shouchella lehensis]
METIIRYIATNPEVAEKMSKGELVFTDIGVEANELLRETFTNGIDLKKVVVNAWKY